MSWETVDGVFKLSFDPLFTTAVAAVLFILGVTLRRHITFLTRFCIPAAVIGGLIMAFIALGIHHQGGASVSFNTALQTPMMLAFFTTVGIGGSLSLLKRGGWALIIYLLACWGLAAFQNAFGVSLARVLGLHPALGVMAGAVSLEGGHGAAAAFGPTAEGLGVVGAQAVAIASATYGLIAGGLLGGPVASWLINSKKLELAASQDGLYKEHQEASGAATLTDSFDLFRMLALVLVIMAIGNLVSNWFNGQAKNVWQWKNFSLPGYVGAMFVAVIFRNLNDGLKIVKIHDRAVDLIADISIGLFLTMAMMSLRIWDLYDLAIPLIVTLLLQTAAIALLAVFVLFPILGRDYDAAVMCAGFMGHGLGATPNAVSNMSAVCQRYEVMSYKAFLIVPLCGAVLIDLVAIPNIVWFINYFAAP
ncbi:MAG: sodium/glutamate symporter [Synergistaceae bacterium]|jgi:ESS family glutamate:Na+ symporter|nr:sodium/glutamate symporter [Synergistaceae bacterium]